MLVHNKTKGYMLDVTDNELQVEVLTKVSATKCCDYCHNVIKQSDTTCPKCKTRLLRQNRTFETKAKGTFVRNTNTIHDKTPNGELEARLTESVRKFMVNKKKRYTNKQNEYTTFLVRDRDVIYL